MNPLIEGVKIQFDFGEASYDGFFITFEQDCCDFMWHISEPSFVSTEDEKLYESFAKVYPEIDYDEFLVMVRAMEKGILLCK